MITAFASLLNANLRSQQDVKIRDYSLNVAIRFTDDFDDESADFACQTAHVI